MKEKQFRMKKSKFITVTYFAASDHTVLAEVQLVKKNRTYKERPEFHLGLAIKATWQLGLAISVKTKSFCRHRPSLDNTRSKLLLKIASYLRASRGLMEARASITRFFCSSYSQHGRHIHTQTCSIAGLRFETSTRRSPRKHCTILLNFAIRSCLPLLVRTFFSLLKLLLYLQMFLFSKPFGISYIGAIIYYFHLS